MFRAIVNRESFEEAISFARRGVASRTPKPVLGCLRIEATEDRLTIASTDLAHVVVVTVKEVQVESQGVVLVPADKLADIVKASDDSTLTLYESPPTKDEGGWIDVLSSDSKFTIYTQKPEEFPPVPEPIHGSSATVTAPVLRDLIHRTAFCVAKESTRYAFNGSLLYLNSNLKIVSTDGRRMAIAQSDAVRTGDDAKLIATALTLKIADVVAKARKDKTATVTIINEPDDTVPLRLRTDAFNRVLDKIDSNKPRDEIGRWMKVLPLLDDQIQFLAGRLDRRDNPTSAGVEIIIDNVRILSNAIEGSFPPYEDVIPRDSDRVATVGTAELVKAVRKASLMTSEESKGMAMQFTEGKGMKIFSRDPSLGKAEVNLPLCYRGISLEIGFNPGFLSEALKVVDRDEVTLKFTAPNRPLLMEAGGFQYVLMPVNLDSSHHKPEPAPAPEPVVEETQQFDPADYLKICADTPETLRRSDVFRLLSECPEQHRETVAQYIRDHRPELEHYVSGALETIDAETPANAEVAVV